MSKTIKIPTSMNPFVVIVNGVKHEYPAGETVEVPDHIAEIIGQYEKGNFPQPVAPTNAIKLVSPGGKVFAVTVDDNGKLTVSRSLAKGEVFKFNIGGNVYTAKAGMTWAEWVESEYAPTYTCNGCVAEYRQYEMDGRRIGYMDGCDCDEFGRNMVVTVFKYDSQEARDELDTTRGTYPTADDLIDPDAPYGFDG